jgi:hypothetical protein
MHLHSGKGAYNLFAILLPVSDAAILPLDSNNLNA